MPAPTEAQKASLARHMETIRKCRSDETANFQKLANAVYQIQEQQLYLCEGFTSEAAFFKKRLGYSRSHGFRLASAGRLLNRWFPLGDPGEQRLRQLLCRQVCRHRGADVYPGLAKKLANGKYAFTGKIQLPPQELGEPLQDKTPKRWFVNSDSRTPDIEVK